MALRENPWPGIRQDVTDLGDGLLDVLNVQYKKAGELRRRPGLGARYALSATQLAFLESAGGKHLIGFDGTTLTSLNMDTAASTSLATGLDTARGSFALANGILYYANGVNSVRAITRGDQVSRPAGIAAPSSAPSESSRTTGDTTLGTHLVRYRRKASSTGYISNPSPALTLSVGNRTTGSGTVSVTNGSASVTFSTSQPAWTSSSELFIADTSYGLVNVSGTSGTLVDDFPGTTGTYAFTLVEAPVYQSWSITIAVTAAVASYITHTIIEMTEADGSTFYKVAEIPSGTGTYAISISDSVLNQGELSDVYAAPDGFGHEPPPSAITTLYSLRNRIFGLDATGTLYWSRAAYPEAFNTLEWAHKVFSNGGDKAIAMGGFMNSLYIFGQRSVAILDYTHDPASGMFTQLPSTLGVWNQNCLISADNRLWGFGRQGIFQVSDVQPKHISAPVADILDNDVDVSAAASFFGFYDPKERCIWFCYQEIGDTGVRNAVVYDVAAKTWSRRSFRHKLNHAIIAGDSTRNDFAYIADDEGGYCWRLEPGVFDGVPSTMTAGGVVSVDTGASTTVIPTTTAMGDVLGAIVYNPDTGEEARITVSGAYSMTVTPAFTSAPAVGTELYIGSIPVSIKSLHVPVEYVYSGRRPAYLEILHLSDTAGVEFDVRYYSDYGTTPAVWTRTADDAMMNGLSITNGQSYATQDVSSGLSTVPVQGEFTKTVQWQLDQTRPVGTMRLLNVSFTWTDQRGVKDIGS